MNLMSNQTEGEVSGLWVLSSRDTDRTRRGPCPVQRSWSEMHNRLIPVTETFFPVELFLDGKTYQLSEDSLRSICLYNVKLLLRKKGYTL